MDPTGRTLDYDDSEADSKDVPARKGPLRVDVNDLDDDLENESKVHCQISLDSV